MNPQNSSNAGFAPAAEQSNREDLSIHGPRPSVTRISRRAVLLTAVFGAAMGLVVLVAGLGNSTPAKRPGVQEENSIRPTGPIESLRDLPQDYSFDVRQAARGIGYDAHAVAPATRPSAPSAQDQALADQLRQLAELRRKMLEEQRKEQDQAMDSPLVFAGAHPAATSTAAVVNRGPATMPTIVMVGRSDGPSGGFGMDQSGNLSGPMSPGGMSGNQRPDDKEAFLTAAAAVEPYLSKPLLAPLSKYELKAGSAIPGALVTAINTDLPGEVIGQVTENVYDSATGNYLLIPQGSRLLGKYQSSVGNGQNRALLAWQRLSATKNWLACWSQMSIVCLTPVGFTNISTMFCVSRTSFAPLRISNNGLKRALSGRVGLKKRQYPIRERKPAVMSHNSFLTS
jgi:type IV secretory pathway VirB10-like protein